MRDRSLIRALPAVAWLLAALLVPGSSAGTQTAPGRDASEGAIVRRDPRFDALVPRSAALEKVADGFAWVEGPVWDRARGRLYFSDIPENSVYTWKEGEGARLFLEPSGYSGAAPFPGREPGANGLALDSQGRLVLCEHGDRRITRLEADGRRTVLADRYQGKRLNSPNDAVFGPGGALYFTDPPFGLPGAFDDPRRELDFSGVYRLSAEGTLTLLTRDLPAPNGIAFSPDGLTLYLSNSHSSRPVWMAYELRADGALGAGRVLFDATPWTRKWKGNPDGMEVDRDGNLFAAGPGGVHVFAPDGTHLGSVLTGVATSNCAWGEDGSVLYITASTAVYRIRLATRGAGF